MIKVRYIEQGLETRDKCIFWGTVSRLDEIQAVKRLSYRFDKIDDLLVMKKEMLIFIINFF